MFPDARFAVQLRTEAEIQACQKVVRTVVEFLLFTVTKLVNALFS